MVVNFGYKKSDSASFDFKTIGVAADDADECSLTDYWTGKDMGTFTGTYESGELDAHDHQIMKVKCVSQKK